MTLLNSYRKRPKMPEKKPDTEIKHARKRAAVSVALNILLAVGKGMAGYISGSTALISDAVHSASDVVASGAAWLGLWVASRKHPSFPYGLYKAETVATLVSALAVLLAAYEIGRQALFGCVSIPDTRIALPAAFVSLIISAGFGYYQVRAGRKLNSPALVADGKDYIADSMSTAVVFVGLVGSMFGIMLDRWAAAVVSLFVFRAGSQLLITALKDLLDASIDRETEREIIRLVESHPAVSRVKQCLSRTAGGRFIIDMDILLRTPSHRVADRIAASLEEDIIKNFPRVVMARIRPHFKEGSIITRVIPVESPESDHPFQHMAKAPWFRVETVDIATGEVTDTKVLRNPHQDAERKRGFLVGKWLLLAAEPDVIILSESHGGTAEELLKEAGVRIITNQEKNSELAHDHGERGH